MRTIIVLPERLDSAAVPMLGDAMDLAKDDAVVLDAGNVEFLGARCAEFLIAAGRTFAGDGGGLRIEDPSSAFADQLGEMGLSVEQLQNPGEGEHGT